MGILKQFHRFTSWVIVFVAFSVDLVISIELIRPFQPKFDILYFENDCNFPNISDLKHGECHLMSTSKSNFSFANSIGKWSSSNKSVDDPTLTYVEIDRRNPFQMSEFLGFGSTFTDSDFEMFQRMPPKLVDCSFEHYFSPNGLNFELLRVPIDRNFEKKREIYLKSSQSKKLKIVAVIRPEGFYSSSKFRSNSTNSMDSVVNLIKSINDENKIEILDVNFTEQVVQNVTDQANQIEKLRMSFNRSNTDLVTPKICLTDCTRRTEQPWLLELEKSHENILNQIDVISLTNHSVSPEFLCRAYKKYRKPIIFTEISEMNQFSAMHVDLWQKTEGLIDRIMSLLLQNIVGYVGPSLISLITFDENGKKLSKHPAFYAMAHFSRNILPNSKRLTATLCGPMMSGIQTIAYLRPDAKILVLLYNSNEISIPVTVADKQIGNINIVLPSKSINSIEYCI